MPCRHGGLLRLSAAATLWRDAAAMALTCKQQHCALALTSMQLTRSWSLAAELPPQTSSDYARLRHTCRCCSADRQTHGLRPRAASRQQSFLEVCSVLLHQPTAAA